MDLGLKNVSLPFTAVDVIDTMMVLFTICAGFLLLRLAFLFVPKIIVLIREANTNRQNRKGGV